jgi:hypothetical protein
MRVIGQVDRPGPPAGETFHWRGGRLAAIGEYYMAIEAPLDAVRTGGPAVRLRTEDAELRRRLAQATA